MSVSVKRMRLCYKFVERMRDKGWFCPSLNSSNAYRVAIRLVGRATVTHLPRSPPCLLAVSQAKWRVDSLTSRRNLCPRSWCSWWADYDWAELCSFAIKGPLKGPKRGLTVFRGVDDRTRYLSSIFQPQNAEFWELAEKLQDANRKRKNLDNPCSPHRVELFSIATLLFNLTAFWFLVCGPWCMGSTMNKFSKQEMVRRVGGLQGKWQSLMLQLPMDDINWQ